MTSSRLTSVLMCVLLAGGTLLTADLDPISVKLDVAKKAYITELDQIKKVLIDTLVKKEELARKDGNKKQVDQLVSERVAFETDGTLPSVAPTKVYVGQVAAARKRLMSSYTEAIKDYVRVKQDHEAAAVEKELEAFKLGAGSGAETDDRKVWATKAGMRFEFVAEKTWKEVNAEGKTRQWTEVKRNHDFVELHLRAEEDAYIRLHATVYYWGTIDRKNNVRHWTEWLSPEAGMGSWKQQP